MKRKFSIEELKKIVDEEPWGVLSELDKTLLLDFFDLIARNRNSEKVKKVLEEKE